MKMSIQNFRSFIDKTELEIRPITLFLGRNSSGKSTASRMIPLLQQTFEARSSAPLLWYGKTVDFGSYNECISKFSTEDGIVIGFEVNRESLPSHVTLYNGPYYQRYRLSLGQDGIKYTVKLSEKNNRTFASEYRISFNGDFVEIIINESGSVEGLLINGKEYTSHCASSQIQISNSGLFPKFLYRRSPVIQKSASYSMFQSCKKEKLSIADYIFHGRTSDEKKNKILDSITYSNKQSFPEVFKSAFKGSGYAHGNAANFAAFNAEGLEKIRHLCLLDLLTAYLDVFERQLRSIFDHSAYIGPLRAAGERYYRWQELAIDRIDPKGENFAMYLMTLSQQEMDQFRKLTKEALNYDVKTERSSGNGSVLIKEEGTDYWFNIADVGFGFSQILPVLAQLHSITFKRKRTPYGPVDRPSLRVLAIEQPELHLHPAYQARLADLFVASTTETNSEDTKKHTGVSIIAETHSEALVNRLSELVSLGRVSKDDIAIYIFDKPDNDSPSQVRIAEFTSDGSIENWPYGFFSYDYTR